jgi:glutathione synthase/RimK-type ligase-like ATP-grasp enzyme
LTRVAILTPDPADESFHGRWRDVFGRMARPLAAEGVEAADVSWVSDEDLSAFDLVLPMNAWGYHRAYERWLARCDAWARTGVRILNPASVLRWNADKRYLGRLWDAGAPAIPTVYVDRPRPEDVAAAAERFGAERLVVKPTVSASAFRTILVSPGDPLDDGPLGPALIQPFLPAVGTDGEVSLIYFAGRFSHSVRKVAKPGDFRVQPEYDSTVAGYDPEADELAAAEAILDAVEDPLLYARVDLVRDRERRPALIELELIEPDLYLGYDPEAGQRFARAVKAAIA